MFIRFLFRMKKSLEQNQRRRRKREVIPSEEECDDL